MRLDVSFLPRGSAIDRSNTDGIVAVFLWVLEIRDIR